jgi:hypothetical protein
MSRSRRTIHRYLIRSRITTTLHTLPSSLPTPHSFLPSPRLPCRSPRFGIHLPRPASHPTASASASASASYGPSSPLVQPNPTHGTHAAPQHARRLQTPTRTAPHRTAPLPADPALPAPCRLSTSRPQHSMYLQLLLARKPTSEPAVRTR